MRREMTVRTQQDEDNANGILRDPPQLTDFRFLRSNSEAPAGNASPAGSIASIRFTVAMTPSHGFDDADTDGAAYAILVAETPQKRWLIAELGGCC